MSHDAFWALVNLAVAVISLIGIGVTYWWVNRRG